MATWPTNQLDAVSGFEADNTDPLKAKAAIQGAIENVNAVVALRGAIDGIPSLVADTIPIYQIPVGTTGTTVAIGNHVHTNFAPLLNPIFTGTITAPELHTTGKATIDGGMTASGTVAADQWALHNGILSSPTDQQSWINLQPQFSPTVGGLTVYAQRTIALAVGSVAIASLVAHSARAQIRATYTAGGSIETGGFLVQPVNNLSSSTIPANFGLRVLNSSQSVTLNTAVDLQYTAGTGKWNLWSVGTAPNYCAGDLRVGTTVPVSTEQLTVVGGANLDALTVGATAVAFLDGSTTWNPTSIAPAAQATSTVTVTGAALGDFVIGKSCSGALGGLILTAEVTATNQVTLYLTNNTAAAIDLPLFTYYVRVMKR